MVPLPPLLYVVLLLLVALVPPGGAAPEAQKTEEQVPLPLQGGGLVLLPITLWAPLLPM